MNSCKTRQNRHSLAVSYWLYGISPRPWSCLNENYAWNSSNPCLFEYNVLLVGKAWFCHQKHNEKMLFINVCIASICKCATNWYTFFFCQSNINFLCVIWSFTHETKNFTFFKGKIVKCYPTFSVMFFVFKSLIYV